MPDTPNTVARAALRFWVHRAVGMTYQWTASTEHSLVHRSAWLVYGTTPPTDTNEWPVVDSAAPLVTIFSRMTTTDQSPPDTVARCFIPRAALRLDEHTIFPTTNPDQATRTHPDTDPITGLRTELERLETHQQVTEETLLYALQQYAWCLPSPLDAISLYDFARIHAAVAAILATNEKTMFLLGGDLSGVQDFIYALTAASGAVRQLRGRSFYLQMLTEAIAHNVLTRLNLPLTNLLYSGGGRFYLLAPATTAEQIPTLRREIGKRLLEHHNGALYLALGGTPYTPDHADHEVWNQVNQAIDRDKRRRFAELDPDELYQRLFTPRQPDYAPEITDSAEHEPDDALSQSLGTLARKLHNSTFLQVQQQQPAAIVARSWEEVLKTFGMTMFPTERLRPDQKKARLLAMRDLTSDEQKKHRTSAGEQVVFGTRYTVNEAPQFTRTDIAEYHWLGLAQEDDQIEPEEGSVKPFSLLARQSQGIDRLGVLRMDVDDLGDLFGSRLERPPGLAGLTSTAALSATLSRFFEGWVGVLCRQVNEACADGSKRGGVYAVYSGGDDLFIVGSWHLLPELAATIRNDFVRYTTGQEPSPDRTPPVTISAGITLHGASFPLYQAADEAHQALEQAKNHPRPTHPKDALCFLDQTIGWEHYPMVKKLQEDLCWLRNQGAPQALLMTLQALYIRSRARSSKRYSISGDEQIVYGPWIWQAAYMLTRLAERNSGTVRESIIKLRDRIINEVPQRFIERAGLAARWAQLLLRQTKENV